jgi:hypothetical protein
MATVATSPPALRYVWTIENWKSLNGTIECPERLSVGDFVFQLSTRRSRGPLLALPITVTAEGTLPQSGIKLEVSFLIQSTPDLKFTRISSLTPIQPTDSYCWSHFLQNIDSFVSPTTGSLVINYDARLVDPAASQVEGQAKQVTPA